MENAKNDLLEKTYQQFVQLVLGQSKPELLKDIVDASVMGFGTAFHEKIFSLADAEAFLKRQFGQLGDSRIKWDAKPLHRHISADRNTAIYADDLVAQARSDKVDSEMNIRLSVIFEYVNHKWLVVYCHGSKPEPVEGNRNTFGLDFWKEKAGTLEKIVRARTEELIVKNRELKIEGALEKVRSRSLAMYKSDELQEVVSEVFVRLNELNIQTDAINLDVYSENLKDAYLWTAISGLAYSREFHVPYAASAIFNDLYEGLMQGKDIHSKVYTRDEKNEFFEYIFNHTDFRYTEEERKKRVLHANGCAISIAYANKSAIIAIRYAQHPFSEEDNHILKRFSKIFDQAYSRFLDLQKVETQAREARIEASLERVRSKAMDMRNSNDLANTIGAFYSELQSYNLVPQRFGVGLINKETKTCELYTCNTTGQGHCLTLIGKLKLEGHPVLDAIYEHWLVQEEYHPVLRGNEIKEYYDVVRPQIAFPDYPYEEAQYGYFIFFPEGGVYAWVNNEMVEDDLQIYRRFTSVLSLTYKRFNDLQKAEAQAREARIEAALERVRAKALAMHSSKDISEATIVVFNELRRLGIEFERCGILIYNDTPIMEVWSTPLSPKDNKIIEVIEGKLDTDTHPLLHGGYKSWVNKEPYFTYELKGEEVKEYYEFLERAPAYRFPKAASYPKRQIINIFNFKEGALFVYQTKPLSEDTKQILNRFTNVFSLTFRRYLDIIKAEEQAKEAIKQASLDRVRGEIASMRSTEDLQRITPLVFNELSTLGVSFIRCGVFILNEQQKRVEVYLSAPDGHSLGVLNLSFDFNETMVKLVDHWQKQSCYKEHWSRDDFMRWTKSMIESGQVQNQEIYQGAGEPPESLDMCFIPFTQGMLYVGNIVPLSEEEIDLVRSLAKTFAMAYSRYEDFNKLEMAKLQIEKTLEDLKQAQSQLIQSEKMASLGELTAGIAHEIQNPLNFVNNFSEVNKEMLEELKAEFLKPHVERDNKLQEELINDVIENSEKINLHGKRAGDIVNSMLQHSRRNTGAKEPTDINALADEYLRLAFHARLSARINHSDGSDSIGKGLREKNKSLNPETQIAIETDFDDTIGKINILPQDFGRVLLNLFNNAFYAVQQKQKELAEKAVAEGSPTFQKLSTLYKPKVWVTTKRTANSVIITVCDNGNGIPKNIFDKIFQPFFTTKPTGQGTGLGLSLAYDIVKAHGGEIKVESTENYGSSFIINLPV